MSDVETTVIVKLGFPSGQEGAETFAESELPVVTTVDDAVAQAKEMVNDAWERGQVTSYDILLRTVMRDEKVLEHQPE